MSLPIPENMIDMITYEILHDPVLADDGHVYSRDSILDWFDGCAENGEPITSPLTGHPMGTNLKPDTQLAKSIEQFKAKGGKSQRFNESTQTIGTLAKIFEIIDPLRDLFATKNWQAPALVVMGNENSGKSTLLERLAMMPIFPKDKFICTRMAIRVHLRRGPIMAPRLDVFDKQSGSVMWSKVIPMERGREFVKEAMESVLIQEFGGLTGVSKTKMLILHITGPQCPDLDMVDLPGLVSTHVRGEPENMRAMTADLVESYVRENNANSLYLVAVPATSAPNQSLAFEVVQKMGLHDRSIGVFTKSDKCDLRDESDGLGGLTDLRTKVYQQARDTVPLEQWGYVCTMNKPQDLSQKNNYQALINQSNEEVQFFNDKGMSDLLGSSMAGCKALLTRVSIMFHDYLRSTWAPSTIILLREEVCDYRAKERALGFPRADTFLQPGQAPEDGIDARVTQVELMSMAIERAHVLLQEVSSHAMDSLTIETMERLHTRIMATSCEVSGKPSEVLGHQLSLKQEISEYITEAVDSIEELVITQITSTMHSDNTDFKLGRFPDFIDEISRIFETQLAPWKSKTEAALMSYVNMAFQSPLSNPHFRLKYTFTRDRNNVMGTSVEMDFDAEALASTIIHTVILRCSIFLTETISVGDIAHFKQVNWIENCAKERAVYLGGLHNVDHVVEQLKEHLELTDDDIVSFQRTGSVLPVDNMNMIRSAIENATITGSIHAPTSVSNSTPSVSSPSHRVPQPQSKPYPQPQPKSQYPQPQPVRSAVQPQPTRGQSQYPPQPQRGGGGAQGSFYPPQPSYR
jgi:GTP-binding protein EngB required for normal cell division